MVKNKSMLTTSSYAEYSGDMKTSTTFTACFWFNIQYFSASNNYIWQYCFVRSEQDLPICTAFGMCRAITKYKLQNYCFKGFKQNLKSLGQDLDILLKSGGQDIFVLI